MNLEQSSQHMFDKRHVLWAVSRSQASEVVVEDDVQDPMQAALDAPKCPRTVAAKVLALSSADERH